MTLLKNISLNICGILTKTLCKSNKYFLYMKFKSNLSKISFTRYRGYSHFRIDFANVYMYQQYKNCIF